LGLHDFHPSFLGDTTAPSLSAIQKNWRNQGFEEELFFAQTNYNSFQEKNMAMLPNHH